MTRTFLRLLTVAGLALTLAACGANDPAGLVASGKKYLEQSNPKSAIIQFKSALQKDPDNAEARFLLAKALLDSSDAPSAEVEARKAVELRYPEDQAVPLLARTLLGQGSAKDSYARLISELGGRKLGTPAARADLAASLTVAYLGTGNVAAAGRAIADAARESPDDPRVLVTQAQVAYARGDRPAVGRFVDQALAKQAGFVDALMMKAALLAEGGQADAAVKLLEDALPASANPMPLRYTLVRLLIGLNRFDAAGTHVAKMKEVAPDTYLTTYADALWSYVHKDIPHARDNVQRLLARGGTPESDLLMLNGLIQYQLGSYAAAEEALRSVLARVPGETNARRTLALTYLRTGRAAQGLELLEPVLRAGSTDPTLWRTAAEVALGTGNIGLATDYFERASELDKQDVGTKVRIAELRMAKGDTQRAFNDLEALSKSSPNALQADLALVLSHLRRREYDDALASAQTMVRKQPDSAVGHNLVGTVQLARRDTAAARASFDKALALDPKNLDAARNLTIIDVQEGKADAARARYDAMLAKDPSNESLLLLSGDLAALTGASTDTARTLYERAIRAQPASPRPRLALINLALRQGDAKAALAAAQEAQAALPRNLQVAEALGNAQLAAKNANQAIDTFQRIVSEQPQNPVAYLRLSNAQAEASDVAAAVTSARKAIALQPTFGPAWVELTKLLQKSNRTDAAVAEARRLQADRPKDSVGWLLEGEIYASAKNWPAAVAAYRQAYARSAQPLIAGRIYLALLHEGKAAEAAAFATQWNREHPKDVSVLVLQAREAQARKDFPNALSLYRAALAIEPDNYILLNNYAWQLAQSNDPAAREYAERAYRVAPFTAGVLDTYGSVLVATGDVPRGLSMLRMATNLEPQDPELRLHLGKALAKGGDKAAARRELETIARTNPQSPLRNDAEKALAEL